VAGLTGNDLQSSALALLCSNFAQRAATVSVKDRERAGNIPAMKSSSNCEGCSRRQLLRGIGVAAAGLVLLDGCLQSGNPSGTTTRCGPSTCIDLSDPANDPLASVGGALVVDVGADTVIVIRASDSEIIAVSAICTHAGCTVEYSGSSQTLDCPCHGARYDQTGHVLRGPAQRDLRKYTATLTDNLVTIS